MVECLAKKYHREARSNNNFNQGKFNTCLVVYVFDKVYKVYSSIFVLKIANLVFPNCQSGIPNLNFLFGCSLYSSLESESILSLARPMCAALMKIPSPRARNLLESFCIALSRQNKRARAHEAIDHACSKDPSEDIGKVASSPQAFPLMGRSPSHMLLHIMFPPLPFPPLVCPNLDHGMDQNNSKRGT
jgi:hypothetical protein